MLNFLRRRKKPDPAISEAGPIDELAALVTFREDGMAELQADKLTELYSLRIPECTARRIKRLSKVQCKTMNEGLLIGIAKFLHDAEFDPNRYLSDDYDTRCNGAR